MDRKSGRLSIQCFILVVLAILLSICLSSTATESNSPSQGLLSPVSDKTDQYKTHQKALARRSLIGSAPPNCVGRCRGCTPCKLKAVKRPPVAHEVTDTDPPPYYPTVWRCKCGGKAYKPGPPPPATTHSSPGRA